MIWALVPKVCHLPEAEASQVCLQTGQAGAAGRTGAGGAPHLGTLGQGVAGEGQTRRWLGRCLWKAEDCEMDRFEEFVLHVILN